MSSSNYRVNAPTVTAETVDGEVLMIHLDSGNYYSLRDTAAAIWDGLEQGAATDTIVEALVGDGAGDGAGDDVRADAERFLAELVAENLIVIAEAPGTTDWAPPAGTATTGVPALEKFTDMQHLILLDPVHEVDAGEGWPVQRSDA